MEQLRAYSHTLHATDVLHVLHDALAARETQWRRVLKALTTITHCLRTGSNEIAHYASTHHALMRRLTRFAHVDAYGLDRGAAVRAEAEAVLGLLQLGVPVRGWEWEWECACAGTGTGICERQQWEQSQSQSHSHSQPHSHTQPHTQTTRTPTPKSKKHGSTSTNPSSSSTQPSTPRQTRRSHTGSATRGFLRGLRVLGVGMCVVSCVDKGTGIGMGIGAGIGTDKETETTRVHPSRPTSGVSRAIWRGGLRARARRGL
ncbi:hypothetical protein K439DRAFT_492483 [Ramaria rubella]|nr:hypothetical protein K439DRAFT_492483 [Ramaria rubella]